MKTIIKFNTENVLRDAFFTYAKYVDEQAQADPVISVECEPFVNELTAAVEQLDQAMVLSQKLPQTDEITAECVQRMSYYRIFSRLVDVACRSLNPEQRSAGETLKQVLVDNRFKSNGKMDYITGALFNLCQDATGLHSEAVEAIGATGVMADLKRSNDTVMLLVSERNSTLSEREKNRVSIVRERVVKAMDNLYIVVNGRSLENQAYFPFIKYVNTYIERMKRSMNIRTRSENNNDSEPTEPGEDEETKTYRWIRFMDGSTQVKRVRCEVGKEIPLDKIPEAPEGTVWGDIPEVMPDEDVYVFAVPEEESGEDNEGGENEGDDNNTPGGGSGDNNTPGTGTPGGTTPGTGNTPGTGGDNTNPGETTEPDHVRAFFIFANGEEETISGLPGSPMQPPINTVGYMWQPAPPRIIPTKDTTYREVVYVDDWK